MDDSFAVMARQHLSLLKEKFNSLLPQGTSTATVSMKADTQAAENTSRVSSADVQRDKQ